MAYLAGWLPSSIANLGWWLSRHQIVSNGSATCRRHRHRSFYHQKPATNSIIYFLISMQLIWVVIIISAITPSNPGAGGMWDIKYPNSDSGFSDNYSRIFINNSMSQPDAISILDQI